MTKQKITLSLLGVTLVLVPHFALAAGLVPCGGYNEEPCNVQFLFSMVAKIISFLIGLGAVLAVIFIIKAGFLMTISAGNESAVEEQKKAIANAIIGFILTLFAFVIINTTVNFLLPTKCKLNLRNPLTYMTIDPNTCQVRQ